MEGVSHEAASFAGHQRLDNLCWIYDNNHISIDGRTEITYDDDVAGRFMGYGWNVTRVGDANDFNSITRAFDAFKATDDRPTLIIVDSHIGYGSPHKQDTAAAHGEPLGERGGARDQALLRLARGRRVPGPRRGPRALRRGRRRARGDAEQRVGEAARRLRARARVARAPDRRDAAARAARGLGSRHPDVRAPTRRGSPPARPRTRSRTRSRRRSRGWSRARPTSPTRPRCGSTFEISGGDFEPDNRAGRQLHYGIREHESAAISNGLSLSKLRPLWSTYLVFSDYARPAIRLSALMELPVIHIFTHDSIGLGEDGPTHQPVEHLASLRAIPGLERDPPLRRERGRRGLAGGDRAPTTSRSRWSSPARTCRSSTARATPRAEGLRRGGYVLADAEGGDPELILIATGSEVALAVEAHEQLAADGVRSRVVSLPSFQLFDQQDQAYRDERAAAVGRRPGLDRGGLDARLGPLRRARAGR